MYSREDTIKLLLNKKADPSTPGGVNHAFLLDFIQDQGDPEMLKK
jgi:hypothetical protein